MAPSAIINNYLQLVCILVETGATGTCQVSDAQPAVEYFWIRREDGWKDKIQKAHIH